MTLLEISQKSNNRPVPVESLKTTLQTALETYDAPSDAVASVFVDAINQYSDRNLTAIWLQGIYQNYCELNTGELQAWRNIGGTAFEKAVVQYYNNQLPKYLRMEHVSDNPEIQDQLTQLARGANVENPTSGEYFGDAVVLGEYDGEWYIYSVLQTMTSFKGRLSDEQWKGELVQELGLFAPLVTLDSASNTDQNIDGEVGSATSRNVPGRIVEEQQAFTNMYSFNQNTEQTPNAEAGGKYQIRTIGQANFDPLVNDLVQAWSEFIQPLSTLNEFRL